MEYVCIASVKGGARCRATVEKLGTFCSFHQKLKEEGREPRLAPKPDTILVKFNLNLDRSQKLEMFGVPRKVTSWVEKEEKHIAQAKQFDRKAYRYRDIADSGVPIFGPQGVQNVSLSIAWEELLEREGYAISDIHLKSQRDGKMDVLVITLEQGLHQGKTLSFGILREFRKLFSSSWGYTHIWANPPDEKGKIVHTVNSAHRFDHSPQQNLCFNHGLWAVEPP